VVKPEDNHNNDHQEKETGPETDETTTGPNAKLDYAR